MSSVNESYTDDDSDDGYLNTDTLEDIRNGSQIHPYITSRDTRLKYMTISEKRKINGKEKTSQWRLWAKFYTKSLRLL